MFGCRDYEECIGGTLSGWCYAKEGRCNTGIDCDIVAETCNEETHYCELLPGHCIIDDDCEWWEYCDQFLKICETESGYCADDIDCEDWEYCDYPSYECRPKYKYCNSDSNNSSH